MMLVRGGGRAAGEGVGRDNRGMQEATGLSNTRVVREYDAYLRVEKGLRPATCEAYGRDLEQFAEHVEGVGRLLVGAAAGGCGGVSWRGCGGMGWMGGRWLGS